jgi:hypothetical protein
MGGAAPKLQWGENVGVGRLHQVGQDRRTVYPASRPDHTVSPTAKSAPSCLLHVQILQGESAEANCSALHTALHYAAAKLDIVIPLRATDEDKAIVVDFDMKIFAEKMHDQGWVLHVLLDEMRAPVLASLPSDALLFVSTIKRIV